MHIDRSSAIHAAKQVGKQSTFRSVSFVVIIGIILLIYFLGTESESDVSHREAHNLVLRGWGATVQDDATIQEGEREEQQRQQQGSGDSSPEENAHEDPRHPNGAGDDGKHGGAAGGSKKQSDPHQQQEHQGKPVRTTAADPTTVEVADEGDEPKYYFELDKPRLPDEAAFRHRPKSKGGQLKPPPDNSSFTAEMRETADHLYKMFSLFDEDEQDKRTMPVYGTGCVGRDCKYLPLMISKLLIGIGHFIVVLNTGEDRWVDLFSAMQFLFPGRFSVFVRPDKLSCAETWNLIIRMGFSIRPIPEQVFIANADWHPHPTPPKVENQMARYCEWSNKHLNLVLNRFLHFSSFSYTRKGYFELGYFDEVIYPALAEDVEFHIKAVSKGMGELGLYDNWLSGSKHINRASQGERKIDERNSRVARHNYIDKKWGVRVGSVRDYGMSSPFKTPFNLPIKHNNSWAVDPEHRKCANTGDGIKMSPTRRCWYNPEVLRKLIPAPGNATFQIPDRLTTKHDKFSHPSFF